ncbi:MAG: hypothetical protein ABI861_08105 [Panacibacter sp.]
MERKEFIKQMAIAGVSITALQSCSAAIIKCTETPTGEEGPFPTKKPGEFVSSNIVSDRVGTALSIKIIVNDINNNCKPLQGAVIDIWHCDSKGEYSEYGGSAGGGMMPPPQGGGQDRRMPPPPPGDNKDGRRPPPMRGGSLQAADHTSDHFLRGRQITNTEGIAAFTSIYPGWYPGRAPHIHAHIFDKNGTSLLITQIAFPEEVTNKVYAQGVYKDHGLPDTSNTSDHVFRGSLANEMARISGNENDGFVLTHSIYVKV